ncbi:DUF1471 domain-containing protein [Enterobacter hormaechei]|uniref:DUF1471 domain-containing protein n=1 Tax=Enterobacter hormaechei TaxID=158836 RepID=UPI00263B5340|nr:DUF1471 domain-containing protein [Enterobacter hormaechei]ELC6456248.1 DUF1471 domain-containing protein [Enterobacter hormaechei]MDN4966287.1 DUF1471 domain-containing protein [Enterobacter hormaechei]MDO6156311.1 DUF1471 domain-containing protein [Enterobacter hormaechei]WNN63393.1 DUF1471 domain-containing protein [Enterobacter hormaechei]
MNIVKIAPIISALYAASFSSYAQSISATGSTLDDAESQIAQKAKQTGADYKITSSYVGNQVHMTATLLK